MELLSKAIPAKTARVGVVGLGYVGLPLAATAARKGFRVIGFDVDPTKMQKLDAGQSYIEAVPSEEIAGLSEAGRLSWTTDFSLLKECDVIVICVPTPLSRQREPDLKYVEATTREIAQHMTTNSLIVLESTTFPGTTDEVLQPILEAGGHVLAKDFFLGFSPEREDPGNPVFRTQTIPKVVGGVDAASGDLTEAFYAQVVDKVVRVSDAATAEAVKITENVFRAVNIALVNELKLIFDKMGIDIWEVVDAAATKPFGYMPFYPGPGLGGHCIPIDPFYLTWKAREHEVPTRFIELAGEINTRMPQHVVDRTREALDRAAGKGLSTSKILLVGLAYKKNVSDMRESPAMRLMQLLEEAGAQVVYLDPHVPEIPPMREYGQFRARQSVDASEIGALNLDAVLIATDHDAIDYKALTALKVPIVDTRNALGRRDLMSSDVTKA